MEVYRVREVKIIDAGSDTLASKRMNREDKIGIVQKSREFRDSRRSRRTDYGGSYHTGRAMGLSLKRDTTDEPDARSGT